ncbi:MAG: S41 family peptidase, partial [bacterium]|nr:S41 family peptidase [bacterium]
QLIELADNQKLKGVILDFRNNPGGLLDQAIILSDAFLKEGVIVSTVGPQGKLIDRQRARIDGYEKDIPVIVLVNEGSASASEIVAGALKNNDRALILGTKTFGKGSVQSVYELPLDAAIKLTVARYLTPGNRSIQSIGIIPDVELDPIIIDKDRLDMIENIRFGEKDLEKHFDGQTEEPEKPEWVLHFLAPTPKDEEEPQYRSGLILEEDTVAQVALSLMDAVTSNSRPEMLNEAGPAIKARQTEENKKVAAALQKLGVRWAQGEIPKKGSPQAEFSFNILKDGKQVKKAVAGETVALKISVKNVGKAPFYKLSAQSESEEGLLKNIEFAFGNIEPDATQSWETKLKIPLASLTEEVLFKLKFKEAHGNPPADAKIIIPVQGLERPRFAYLYSLEDQWAAKLKSEKGIAMSVKVVNQGEGASKTAIVSLKNLNGKEVFIEKGRIVLDPIDPGKSATALLRLHIDPEWQKEIQLELNVTDTDLLVNTKQEITLNLEKGKTWPLPGVLYSPPAITIAGKTAGPVKNPYLLEGEAKDDKTIKDFFIFLDDKKVFYESNAKGGGTLPFQVNLDLKKGNNTIVLTARDDMNLVTRQFFVVQYESPSKEEKKRVGKEGIKR